MHFSRQVQYGISGLFDLAYNGGGEPVRVQAIGERQRIPYRFLEQIFQKLRRAGLVNGKRGPGGGYVLARPAEAINLRELVEAIEGPLDLGRHTDSDSDPQSETPHRPDFLWPELSREVAAVLERVAISDLCREAVRRNLARDLPNGFDYQI